MNLLVVRVVVVFVLQNPSQLLLMFKISNLAGAVCLLFLSLPVGYAQDTEIEVEAVKSGVSDSVADEALPSPMQLYRAYLDKSGGLAHLSKLNSVKMTGSILMGERGDVVAVSIYRKRPDKMRIKMEFPNHVLETIFDGKSGMRRHLDLNGDVIGSEQLSGEDLVHLARSSLMDGLFQQLARELSDVEQLSWDKVNGIVAIRVDLVADNQLGYDAVWLDKETLQESKLRRILKDPETGEGSVEETYFSEMDLVEGYFFPRVSRTYVEGEFQQEVRVERIRLNSGIFDSYFKMPE